MEVHIESFKPEMTADTARMLARAFVTNPINAAALGVDRTDRNETFFLRALGLMSGKRFVAVDQERVVGFVNWIDAPACQPSSAAQLAAVVSLVVTFGPGVAMRVGRWLSVWGRNDPAEDHSHLGPIGVDPEFQRRRIGSRLMERYCSDIDAEAKAGYLETDRPGNVPFYERFGFEVVKELPVLGVANYFMWREARPTSIVETNQSGSDNGRS